MPKAANLSDLGWLVEYLSRCLSAERQNRGGFGLVNVILKVRSAVLVDFLFDLLS